MSHNALTQTNTLSDTDRGEQLLMSHAAMETNQEATRGVCVCVCVSLGFGVDLTEIVARETLPY